MIDVPARLLKTIKVILRKNVPQCEIRVFGSRMAGKAKTHSDLDLAIVAKKRIAPTPENREGNVTIPWRA